MAAKIQFRMISGTPGKAEPLEYEVFLQYGEGKGAHIRFQVDVPLSDQTQKFHLAEKEFDRVLAALREAVRSPTDESPQ